MTVKMSTVTVECSISSDKSNFVNKCLNYSQIDGRGIDIIVGSFEGVSICNYQLFNE